MHALRRCTTFALGLAGLLALPGCARNAATGTRQFSMISESQEIQLGRDQDQLVTASLGLYDDPALQAFIQQLGTRLAATTERPGLPWTFRIVDDPSVNAFALPGGFIYVTRGLLAHLDSEAQLASVLGHEIGHVTGRHSVSQLSRQQLAGFGLAIGSVLSPAAARYGDLAGTGLTVLFLKYSRDDEQQADDLGLRYLARGGWDRNEMPGVFTMLERVSAASGGGRLPDWLATHPSPANRRTRITAAIAAAPAAPRAIVNRDSYVRRLERLVYGTDPREGYFEGSAFLHPGMRFRLVFPHGWTTANQKQSVGAISPQEDAIVQVTLADESTAHDAAVRFLAQPGTRGPVPHRGTVAGLPSVSGAFSAVVEGGTLQGEVVFVEYGGRVYRLLGYAADDRWPAYRAVVGPALRSFAPLLDPVALSAQPNRLHLVTPSRATTLAALQSGRVSAVPLTTLALLNQVEPFTPLAAGHPVKWVTATAP